VVFFARGDRLWLSGHREKLSVLQIGFGEVTLRVDVCVGDVGVTLPCVCGRVRTIVNSNSKQNIVVSQLYFLRIILLTISYEESLSLPRIPPKNRVPMAKVKRNTNSNYTHRFTPNSSSVYQEKIYISHKFTKFKTKFRTKCFETGSLLDAGTIVAFDVLSRKVFSLNSPTYAYYLTSTSRLVRGINWAKV
jgi:hypothetical protein